MKIVAVDRKGAEHIIEGRDGWSVMEIIRDAGLPIAAECGGACACATCHVYVDPAWASALPKPTELEADMLGFAYEPDERSRLSCQIKMTPELDGLTVYLPERQ